MCLTAAPHVRNYVVRVASATARTVLGGWCLHCSRGAYVLFNVLNIVHDIMGNAQSRDVTVFDK